MYLFEIEANEKPIFEKGQWEDDNTLTTIRENSEDQEVSAYGEIEFGKYTELYNAAH